MERLPTQWFKLRSNPEFDLKTRAKVLAIIENGLDEWNHALGQKALRLVKWPWIRKVDFEVAFEDQNGFRADFGESFKYVTGFEEFDESIISGQNLSMCLPLAPQMAKPKAAIHIFPNGAPYDFDELILNGPAKIMSFIFAHEVGHALGLAHIEEPESIMNTTSDGLPDQISKIDVEAIQRLFAEGKYGIPTT